MGREICPRRARMAVLKTWTNGWTTSYRFHEDVLLPRIFGCGGMDTLEHYLSCDCLWPLLLSVTRAKSSHLMDPPECRACLSNPTRWHILNCWYAFQVYHAIKISHREWIECAIRENDFTPILSHALELLNLFCELQLNTSQL